MMYCEKPFPVSPRASEAEAPALPCAIAEAAIAKPEKIPQIQAAAGSIVPATNLSLSCCIKRKP